LTGHGVARQSPIKHHPAIPDTGKAACGQREKLISIPIYNYFYTFGLSVDLLFIISFFVLFELQLK